MTHAAETSKIAVRTNDHDQGRIPFALRIGVTGHRNVEATDRLISAVREAIDTLAHRVPFGEFETATPILTVVSSLAEGADRIVAREVLRRPGARLEVVLPMDRDAYEASFVNGEDSQDEFENLIKVADVVRRVPPEPGTKEAFRSAGRAVVFLSDVVIAIWDGKQARGVGGTGEIVELARSQQLPLVWLSPDGDRSVTERAGEDEGAGFGTLTKEAIEPLVRFNDVSFKDRVFDAALCATRQELRGSSLDSTALPLEAFLDWCAPYYARADLVARRFQGRYQKLSLMLWTLAACAVLIVAVQVVWFPETPSIVGLEVLALLGIIGGFIYGRWRRLHERWISARFLSERLRSAFYLGLAGLSGQRASNLKTRLLIEDPSDAWIRRAYGEVSARRPWWSPRSAHLAELTSFLGDVWIQRQARYHERSAARYLKIHHLMTRSTVVLFAMGAVAASVHFLLPYFAGEHPAVALEITEKMGTTFSIGAPACGAALSGYAGQRDFRRHALRYRRMAGLLTDARETLLASDDCETLLSVAEDVDRLMREESGDWFGAVRLHDLELPA